MNDQANLELVINKAAKGCKLPINFCDIRQDCLVRAISRNCLVAEVYIEVLRNQYSKIKDSGNRGLIFIVYLAYILAYEKRIDKVPKIKPFQKDEYIAFIRIVRRLAEDYQGDDENFASSDFIEFFYAHFYSMLNHRSHSFEYLMRWYHIRSELDEQFFRGINSSLIENINVLGALIQDLKTDNELRQFATFNTNQLRIIKAFIDAEIKHLDEWTDEDWSDFKNGKIDEMNFNYCWNDQEYFNQKNEIPKYAAVHQAAHAVSSWHSGCHVCRQVTLKTPNELKNNSDVTFRGNGLISWGTVEGGLRYPHKLPLEDCIPENCSVEKRDAWKNRFMFDSELDVIDWLAGPLAELKFNNRELDKANLCSLFGDGNDVISAKARIELMASGGEEAELIFERLIKKTGKFIDEYWIAINAVADELFRKRSLNSIELIKIIEATGAIVNAEIAEIIKEIDSACLT